MLSEEWMLFLMKMDLSLFKKEISDRMDEKSMWCLKAGKRPIFYSDEHRKVVLDFVMSEIIINNINKKNYGKHI